MRLAWKSFYSLGFILLLIFTGCGERELPVDELVQQAEGLLDAGQIENALLILERCQERAPERVDVLEALAFAYAASGDPMLASMNFLKIAELVPEQPEYLLYAAESQIEAGDLKGAVARYAAYLEANPGDRAVWVTLADLQYSQGRLNEALEALLAAENLEPRPQQQIAIGEWYLRSRNLAQAQVWFARALDGGAEFRDEALLGLLETSIRAKRFADGEKLLTQLEAEYPGRLEQSDLDDIQDQLGEWRRRQEAAREALAVLETPRTGIVLPEDADAPVNPPEEPVAEEAVAVVPAPPPPEPEVAPVRDEPLSLARSAFAEGNMEEAIRHFKRSLVLDDSQSAVWAELSEAYLRAGNDRWAQATASEAVRRDPANPKLVLQFLRAGQRTMDSERLIREMEAAYRNFPSQPEIILVLARAYRDQNNLRNARLLFRRFLQVVPADYPGRPMVEEELRSLGG